jgi:hypothetical protein
MAQEKVHSYPTKILFLYILTQDLDLHDCIMDLLDNSIDSYRRHDLKDRKTINISFSREQFEIYDSCGGIEKEILTKRAFVFGVEELKREKKSLGLFGIGMKRALFKIGRMIEIETDDGQFLNKMKIDVDAWRNDKNNWDFIVDSQKSPKGAVKGYTRIKITNLYDEIKLKFDTNPFLDDIQKSIHVMYTRFLKDDVDIFVNDIKVEPFNIEMIFDDDYKPARLREKYDDVDIDILCYIEPHIGRTARETGRRGWNIFLNDRLILPDDTSKITGWDAEKGLLPNYHPIFNEFRGLVFLSSDDPSKLPINTSKNGLNTDTKIYNYVLKNMVNTARPVINHLTKKYDDQKKKTESIEESIITPIKQLTKLDLYSLPDRDITFIAPKIKSRSDATITYKKPKEIVEKVRNRLGVKTNSEVGIGTFNYYIKLEEIK